MTEIHDSSARPIAGNHSGGLLDWITNLIRRMFGDPAETSSTTSSNGAALTNHKGSDSDIIIAPGGYQIRRPGSTDSTNSLDNLLPDVREGLHLLPPLPTVVLELMKEIQSETSSASSVANIAANDPSLAASLLRTVNSAAFGLPNKINSVSQAVSYLGFGSVRSLVVQMRLERMLPQRNAQAAAEAEDLWAHALAVSYIASALAERMPDVDRGFIATLGLLHDIGRMAMLSQFPDRAAKLRAAKIVEDETCLQREARIFGADHAAIGAMLGNRWQLPADLTLAIRWHHCPELAYHSTDPLPLRKALCLVQIADQLAKYCFAYAEDVEISEPSPMAVELLGIDHPLEQMIDAKVRAAATQAILLADENSNRPANSVRPFLRLRSGEAAVQLAARLANERADGPRIQLCDSCDEFIDQAAHTVNFPASRKRPDGNNQTNRFTAPVTADGAKWLTQTIWGQWEELSISAKLRGPSRATLRALLANLVRPDSKSANVETTEVAYLWNATDLQFAVRSPSMAFASRFPKTADIAHCRRMLEAELANILNLGWFDIETSADGTTLRFHCK
ncbi:MAG: HDOD domain-containing protein [Tepidisphaeraceae bacterium]|jgi:putative nucleotidyltransferase with HDIG domain